MNLNDNTLENIFNNICEVQSNNPPNTFGSYGNFFNTTIDWGIREYLQKENIEEDDNLIDTITDEIKYHYF